MTGLGIGFDATGQQRSIGRTGAGTHLTLISWTEETNERRTAASGGQTVRSQHGERASVD